MEFASDLTECPFCYATIMPREDGRCPACGKKPADAPPERLKFSAAEIIEGQDLPACCVLCGSDTENIETFVYRYDSHLGGNFDENSYFAFTLLTVATMGLGLLFLPMYREHLRKYREMTYQINLPYCESCLPEKPAYEPLNIEGKVYHFKVHKTFKARLLAERAAYPPKLG